MTTQQSVLLPTPPLGPGEGLDVGVYIQVYRGAMRGTAAQQLHARADMVRAASSLGCPGIVWHGFPEELLASWDPLAKLAIDIGLKPVAAWGLDGKKLSVEKKGDLVGELLERPNCAAGLLDEESQYDRDDGPADDMDEAGALRLVQHIRMKSPRKPLGHQPWYAIRSHAGVRRTAKPVELGGTLAGFPVDETSLACNLGHFPQGYIYRSQGLDYVPTFKRMDDDWTAIAPALAAIAPARPRGVTVQGYGWILHELVDCLVNRCTKPSMPLFMWAEPWPDAVAIQALRALRWLRSNGFARPGVSAIDAVKAAQTDLNLRLGLRLGVDGRFGDLTAAAARIP